MAMNLLAALLIWGTLVYPAESSGRPLAADGPGPLPGSTAQLDLMTACVCSPDCSVDRRERLVHCARYLLEAKESEEAGGSEAVLADPELSRAARLGRLLAHAHDLAVMAHAPDRNSHLRC